mgnify:CR=1 FL=1|tara:strand:+ start:110 stop:379 length:270 start_codon:yes stop_codon:yes gene_type:complete
MVPKHYPLDLDLDIQSKEKFNIFQNEKLKILQKFLSNQLYQNIYKRINPTIIRRPFISLYVLPLGISLLSYGEQENRIYLNKRFVKVKY